MITLVLGQRFFEAFHPFLFFFDSAQIRTGMDEGFFSVRFTLAYSSFAANSLSNANRLLTRKWESVRTLSLQHSQQVTQFYAHRYPRAAYTLKK